MEAQPTTDARATDVTERPGPEAIRAFELSTSDGQALTAPPWRQWTPEGADPRLAPGQQALLGIGLMVRRAPAVVRTTAFAVAVQRWREGRSGIDEQNARFDRQGDSLQVDPTTGRLETPIPESTQKRRTAAQEGSNSVTPLANDTASGHTQEKRVSSEQGPALAAPRGEDADRDLAGRAPGTLASLPELAAATPGDPQPGADTRGGQSVDQLPEPQAIPALAEVIETTYGGLFYLINLGIYLELYADFTTPLSPGIELNIYDFVALVGERLLGEALLADPVWPLLAELAGREVDQPPGQDFTPPAGESLAEWLDVQMDTIRTRLVQALDLEENPALLPALLCVHQARVVVSATHIDVVFSLAALPIQIRLSGLDRNPGWVPAAGRYVTFYFE